MKQRQKVIKKVKLILGGREMKSGIKDGINLRERKVKRGYLRQEEMNQIMMLGATHQLLMGIRSLT